MWEFTASHLSPNFQMYALEQRGHGDSSKPDGGYTGEEYSEDLWAFMEAQGIAQAILVGHSLGGGEWLRYSLGPTPILLKR